jgi:hypothetical protein
LSLNTRQRKIIIDYATTLLEKSDVPVNSIKSIISAANRLSSINIEYIFTYKSQLEINDMCAHLNKLKRKSAEAFRPFISPSTRTLCHSMGNPLKVAEDTVEIADKNNILNSLLKIVTLLSYHYAAAASTAALVGDCQFSEFSLVFDEHNSSPTYRKEIAHMARYYRLHLGSFLAIELSKELKKTLPLPYKDNRFESVIELYEAGCADYIFNSVVSSSKNTLEEKLVTPILMDLGNSSGNNSRKVLGIHIYGDEKIKLWKRWGDGYDRLMDMSGNKSNITMEVTPFSNSVAII